MTALEDVRSDLVDVPGTVPGGAVADVERLRLLGEAAARLARALPVLPRRMTLRAGDCAVELDLADPPALVAPVPGPAARVGDGAAITAGRPGTVSGEAPGDGTTSPGQAWSPPPGTTVVRAPLVGTLFVAPAPGADPFVTVGDPVTPGQQLAIVEAMKLMNPLCADVAGTVLEVLADDGASVEYDQPLLLGPAAPEPAVSILPLASTSTFRSAHRADRAPHTVREPSGGIAMPSTTFTLSDLLDLLTLKAGLAPADRTDDPSATLERVGLDSLAFLALQTELQDRFGFKLPEDTPILEYTLGEMVDHVNERLGVSAVRADAS